MMEATTADDYRSKQPPRRKISANPSLQAVGAQTGTERTRSRPIEISAQTLAFAKTMININHYHFH
jgi:hypothetical protein